MTSTVPGVIHITGRALRSYASAIVAEQLGTRAKDVDVTLGDDRGLLALQVSTPLAANDDGHPSAGTSAPGGVVDSVVAARASIRERMTQLTGRTVGRVDVTITRRRTPERSRVR